jgi:hypothetical protein
MESAERLQKNIGIVLSCIVIFAVGAVTFFNESGPDIVSTTPIDATSSLPVTSTIVAQNPPATSQPQPITAPVVPAVTPAITPKKTASVYTDGTYSATGSYMSPGGEDQISVTLTLAHDIITNVSATEGAGDGTSRRYQNAFLSGYKQYVIGQNIANVNLTRVSGSSLTPIGFDDALAQIKAQAKA